MTKINWGRTCCKSDKFLTTWRHRNNLNKRFLLNPITLGCVYIKLFWLNRAFSWHCIDIALMYISRTPITYYSMYIFFHSHPIHQTCSSNKPDSTQVCESTCLKFTLSLVYFSLATVNTNWSQKLLEPHF